MSSTGTITQQQFENFLQAFHKKAKALNDDWMILEFEQVLKQNCKAIKVSGRFYGKISVLGCTIV